jgi:hypothetical protein
MPIAQVSRGIWLTAGCYEWRLWFAGTAVQNGEREIYLASDNYSWIDQLIPSAGYYMQKSYLQEAGHIGMATNPSSATSWGVDVVYSSSTVTWGSSLQWLHGGNC